MIDSRPAPRATVPPTRAQDGTGGRSKRTEAAPVPRTPVAAAIDGAVKCVWCGASLGGCDCAERFRTFDLVLPLPPNMANGRMHWRAKDRKRKAYLAECDSWQMRNEYTPPPPKQPHAFVEMRALLTLWNPMDDDGAMARLKWSIDWLVTRGYLAGDSRKHIKWRELPEQEIDRKRHGTVVFRIYPQGAA